MLKIVFTIMTVVFLYYLKHYTKALAMINNLLIYRISRESLAHQVYLLIVQLHIIDTNKPAEALKSITCIESKLLSTDNTTNVLTGRADQRSHKHTETDKTEKKVNLDAATDTY